MSVTSKMQIFDRQQSIIAANGNVALAKELFSMLLGELDSRFQQIESSFKNNDLDTLAEHTHKLYGATAYCIVPQLREDAQKLDEALSEKKDSQLAPLVASVLKSMTQLINEGAVFLETDWNKQE